MKRLLSITLLLCASQCSFSQTPAPAPAPAAQPPAMANYSIMLVNPTGGGVVIMHDPQNMLALVDVSKVQTALNMGYAPVRAAELVELIDTFKAEIARLSNENSQLKAVQDKQASSATLSELKDQANIQAHQRSQIADDKAAHRQQVLAMWGLAMIGMSRQQPYQLPMPVNPNAGRLKTNCTTQYIGTMAYTNCN
ncbi:hypothetical protein ACFPT7_02210 [Acidicapsa dinghuensis]|uniref:Uncharacterized protein n=1 Tax=Acidicapsa dinghuensis TaxID=2218256 RepID=A0ABW1EAY7_9BACT|nr:hypothetical protein [Acidicapsa dinghuensis]